MLNILKFLLKPLKTEYLMILFAMKTVVMIFSICWLMVVVNAVAATQQQPQSLNYKQQLQYQMQQHDKFEYQQHMKQQQQFYQQQYHQQQAPTSMALLQEQQQQEQQQKQRLQQQQQQYLAMKPSQMLQTAASLADNDNSDSEALFKLNFKRITPSFKVAKGKKVNNLKEKLKFPAKLITEKSTTQDVNTKTMGSGGSAYRYTTSTTTPSTTTPTSTTTTSTHLPMTTTTITSTTTTSSSTMNITPNLDLNTEGIRKSIQDNLHKNPIEGEESFKKSLPSERKDKEKYSDLENFSEETMKSTKYLETSTITNEMKLYSPPSISYPSSPNPSTENLNDMLSFDIEDDSIDFLELKDDDKSGNRLFQILEHNNITLEELIEHRIRGSSQLHLTTIVESSPRFYPDEKSALQDNMDIVTVIENLPHFSLFNLMSDKPYNIKTDSEVTNYFASSIDIENTDEV